jgi:hypothetical protein
MSNTLRVTLTLPADVLSEARKMSQGNLSQFVGNVLREHLEAERMLRLHEALVAGYQANAEEALEMAEAFRYAEDEAVARYVPPYIADEMAELHGESK